MYCERNRIVFTNTVESRFQLAFEESMPEIRNGIFFPNHTKEKKERLDAQIKRKEAQKKLH